MHSILVIFNKSSASIAFKLRGKENVCVSYSFQRSLALKKYKILSIILAMYYTPHIILLNLAQKLIWSF